MPVRNRREIRTALKCYLGMLSRDPGLREPMRHIIKKHRKAMREMLRRAPIFSLQVTSVAAARASLADAAKSGRWEGPDVGTPTVRVTVHAPKVEALLESQKQAKANCERTQTIAATVIAVLPGFQQVRVEGPDGCQYAITAKTPGIAWAALRARRTT